ncbi:DUF1843 domain-containing protein [Nonomuraea candida]|uniref:DUF1843 domain-containing protein n=1 Tax=Nonomuraea candida TaxID=359159 RepID=UPI0005B7BA3C|nr:DUF1843 domain-containing protein [Nonomuraea candida]
MTDREDDSVSRPLPPYGPAIHDAIASNDLQQMKAVAEGARKALYQVDFGPVPAERYGEVKEALEALDAAIIRLDRTGGTDG